MTIAIRRTRILFLTSLALAALAAGVLTTLWLWPITYLSYVVDLPTRQVIDVTPGGPADQGGLQVGDQIARLYGLPYDEVLASWDIVPLIGPSDAPIPMTIVRDGATVALQIVGGPPPAAFQASKLVSALLALICWLTGWLLGIVRRHEALASPTVAAFWITLGGALGMYQFARFASLPLLAILQWLFLTILTPLGVYIHLRFPVRAIPRRVAETARTALLTTWLTFTVLFMGALALWHPTIPTLVTTSARLLPLAFCIAFVSSGVLLARAYRQTQVTHVRRQIRLIASACIVVGVVWLVLLAIPTLRDSLPSIADAWLDLLTGLIPLAYLISGVLPSLYQLDRIVRRSCALLTTIGVLAALLTVAATLLPAGLITMVGLISICVLGYLPIATLVGRIFADRDRSYEPLHTAAHALTTTLDSRVLAEVFTQGLCETFHHPRCGLYLADPDTAGAFQRVLQADAPSLPTRAEPGALLRSLAHQPSITEARILHEQLRFADLRPEESALLHAPDIALWIVVRHAQGGLLGFVLLGTDRSLDPYRVKDLREIQRLIDAAALAFTNSAAYQQQCDAEAVIRDLYHEVQRVQDATTATLARELHDEIINVNVRLNIRSIQTALDQPTTPALRAELETLLASEQNIAETLRVICERLHPSGLDDPLGLPNLLRLQTERAETIWPGECQLRVIGHLVPITEPQQREALRIVREGLNNAVKHADATNILVTLRYPVQANDDITVIVEDNGRSGTTVRSRAGHRGIRGMHESAHAAGGRLWFERRESGGTRLVFAFPPKSPGAQTAERYPGWSSVGESRYAQTTRS